MSSEPIEELVERSIACMDGQVKPRLRFDKVALRFLRTMKTALAEAAPDGVTVAFTIAAPIRVASRTGAELEKKIRTHLSRRSSDSDFREAIEGNDIRVRILLGPRGSPKAVGFVHTAEPSAAKSLLDATEAVLGSAIGDRKRIGRGS